MPCSLRDENAKNNTTTSYSRKSRILQKDTRKYYLEVELGIQHNSDSDPRLSK